jgi:hypothetical protein
LTKEREREALQLPKAKKNVHNKWDETRQGKVAAFPRQNK